MCREAESKYLFAVIFWRFHDGVFDDQASPTTENIRAKLKALSKQDKAFNKDAFETWVDDPD
jgi:hypothetical protein